MPALTVLDREMYTESQAARLLRLAPSTLHYWLEGGTRRNKTYKPVIRAEATGSNRVTWAEFIEAGLLRQYRQDLQVPMLELRSFIALLRDHFDVPYPLAHQHPYVAERKLVVEAQDEAHLGADFALVAPVSGQYMLLPAAQAFYDRVTWVDDIAQQWRPDDRGDSPVTIDPDMRFGSPSIGGISTSILFEQSESGEDEEDLAGTFGLSLAEVRWALSYELVNSAA
ncbi:DUF433 domain-containing protein [uncultured Friedmanniella sp.]|uniref:DUF433 domain-containing protein n=1 Tax=uncultured Friedmanniella sp. TaxID=335381 RepID=UPI0035CABC25